LLSEAHTCENNPPTRRNNQQTQRTGSPTGSSVTRSPSGLFPANRDVRGAELNALVIGVPVGPAITGRSRISRSMMLPEKTADEDVGGGAEEVDGNGSSPRVDTTGAKDEAVSAIEVRVSGGDGAWRSPIDSTTPTPGDGGSLTGVFVLPSRERLALSALARMLFAFVSSDASVGQSSNARSNARAASSKRSRADSAHAFR
jgi:hypothetical protein